MHAVSHNAIVKHARRPSGSGMRHKRSAHAFRGRQVDCVAMLGGEPSWGRAQQRRNGAIAWSILVTRRLTNFTARRRSVGFINDDVVGESVADAGVHGGKPGSAIERRRNARKPLIRIKPLQGLRGGASAPRLTSNSVSIGTAIRFWYARAVEWLVGHKVPKRTEMVAHGAHTIARGRSDARLPKANGPRNSIRTAA